MVHSPKGAKFTGYTKGGGKADGSHGYWKSGFPRQGSPSEFLRSLPDKFSMISEVPKIHGAHQGGHQRAPFSI